MSLIVPRIDPQIARVRDRRDALAAQHAEAQRAYAELEQSLVTLQRQLDAQHGALEAYDEVLELLNQGETNGS